MGAPEGNPVSAVLPFTRGTSPATMRARKAWWRELLEVLVLAALLAVFTRTFVIQAFHIPSGSMEQSLLVGDWLFVNKFLYGAEIPFSGGVRLPALRQPEHGDVVVFRFPGDTSQDYIKRVVAVEGDTVEYRNKTLLVNSVPQLEPYVQHVDGRRTVPGRDEFGPVVVPEGKLFVMGDNRDRSSDSRSWGFLDERLLRGKAAFIYWSWDGSRKRPRMGRLLQPID